MATAGIAWSFQPQAKLAARIDTNAEQRNWPQVLEDGRKIHVATSATVFDINRALVHSGRMLDDMFSYPQSVGWDFWSDVGPVVDLNKVLKGSDLLWELGHVNRAQRMAGEALELTGYRPATLQRMFLINAIKGEPESGRPFLNLLSQTMWHRAWAERYKKALLQDPTLANDEELRSVRRVMISSDYVGAIPENVVLQSCLRQDSGNRMAFDLLMAWYLLDRNVTKVCQNLDRLDAVGLTRLPRHLEEAVLLSQQLNPTKEVRLFGRSISPATVERHKQFIREVGKRRMDDPASESMLAPQFGDTFWFYYLYQHSGSLASGNVPGPQ